MVTTAKQAAPRRSARQGMTKGQRTHARILATAMDLFSESGFHAVSLRDIAARAGITHVGLLHHFANKDQLLLELLDLRDTHKLTGPIDADGNITGGLTGVIPAEVALAGVIGAVRSNMQSRPLISLFVKISAEATDPEHPAHDFFQRRYASVHKLFARLFERRFETDPPPRPTTAHLAATQLIALMDGVQLQWMLDPTIDMVVPIRDFLISLGIDPTEDEIAQYEHLVDEAATGEPTTTTHGADRQTSTPAATAATLTAEKG